MAAIVVSHPGNVLIIGAVQAIQPRQTKTGGLYSNKQLPLPDPEFNTSHSQCVFGLFSPWIGPVWFASPVGAIFLRLSDVKKESLTMGRGQVGAGPDERFLAKTSILADDSHRGNHGKIDLGFVDVIEKIRERIDRDAANHFDDCGIVVTYPLELFELLV